MLRGLKIMLGFCGTERRCRGEPIRFMKNQPTIHPERGAPLKYAKIEFERQARTENESCWNLIRSNYGRIHRIAIRGRAVCFSSSESDVSTVTLHYGHWEKRIQKLAFIHYWIREKNVLVRLSLVFIFSLQRPWRPTRPELPAPTLPCGVKTLFYCSVHLLALWNISHFIDI